MKDKKIYKIIFIQLGEIYEIFAKQIFQSDMYGFLEVEEFIFTNDDQLVVDPSSEKLKTEFNKVKSCLLYTSPSPRDPVSSRMPSSA